MIHLLCVDFLKWHLNPISRDMEGWSHKLARLEVCHLKPSSEPVFHRFGRKLNVSNGILHLLFTFKLFNTEV